MDVVFEKIGLFIAVSYKDSIYILFYSSLKVIS
jgi:hypothetical protein